LGKWLKINSHWVDKHEDELAAAIVRWDLFCRENKIRLPKALLTNEEGKINREGENKYCKRVQKEDAENFLCLDHKDAKTSVKKSDPSSSKESEIELKYEEFEVADLVTASRGVYSNGLKKICLIHVKPYDSDKLHKLFNQARNYTNLLLYDAQFQLSFKGVIEDVCHFLYQLMKNIVNFRIIYKLSR
jgi:uncharacterized protein (TIGR04141 family)